MKLIDPVGGLPTMDPPEQASPQCRKDDAVNEQRRFFPPSKGGILLLLAVVISMAAGCARTPTASGVVRVAILDGELQYEVPPEGNVVRDGWWFGSRDRYTSSNTGVIAGEVLSREFAKLPGVEVYSREDLALYMGYKERILRRAHPQLSPQGRRDILAAQDPIDFGRSLNVDYVVKPEILWASTTTNLTTSIWRSDLEMSLSIYHVESGRRVGYMYRKNYRLFVSQLTLLESFATRAARKVRREDTFALYGG